jgi:hypothetical protein
VAAVWGWGTTTRLLVPCDGRHPLLVPRTLLEVAPRHNTADATLQAWAITFLHVGRETLSETAGLHARLPAIAAHIEHPWLLGARAATPCRDTTGRVMAAFRATRIHDLCARAVWDTPILNHWGLQPLLDRRVKDGNAGAACGGGTIAALVFEVCVPFLAVMARVDGGGL